MSFWLSVCLSVCSLLRYRLDAFLPPLPKNDVQYFKRFRVLEEKGCKQVVSDLETLTQIGCEIAVKERKKSANLGLINQLLLSQQIQGFLWYHLNVFLLPLSEVRCLTFLEIRNPWGKVIERSGPRFELFCLKMILKKCRSKKSFLQIFYFICSLQLTSFCPHFPKSNVKTF